MPKTLKDREWDILLERIQLGKCTPFLGAGACFGALPLGSEIAQKWAKDYHYPMEDSADDLARVAQFIAVEYNDWVYPKDLLLKQFFSNVAPPNFKKQDEPHGVLAELPLPVYMTTNYDDFMVQALRSQNKDPKQELCRWNKLVKNRPSVFDSGSDFKPTTANPVVYHLHGHGPQEYSHSLVLTEDDYLDFLVNISTDRGLIPTRIQEALTGASLMFIGYGLRDWDFRVLFRGLVTSMEKILRRISVTVQLEPGPGQQEQQSYLDRYFDEENMRVYWGTAREFSAELRDRCRGRKIIK